MNDSEASCHETVDRLLSAARVVERRLEEEVEGEAGLSLAQLDFLHHVDRASGALALGKVAEGLCCVRSNVTQLADRLEKQGWIRREDDPDDRRCVQAVLTDEGRRRLERGWEARMRVERRIAKEAGNGDFGRVLERIRGRFE